ISTVDPDARHAHKTRSRRQDGYTAHIVAEPDTGIITNTTLTPAAGPDNSDAAVGIDMLLNEHDQPAGQEPAGQEPAGQEQAGQEPAGQGGRWEVLADSAYGTGEALVALHDAG